jgi:hypothetical protein
MFANISNEDFLEKCTLLPVERADPEKFELKPGPQDFETRIELRDNLKRRFPDREYSFESHDGVPILQVKRIR